MNKKRQINNENEQIKDIDYSVALDKISTKSNNIKAMMKFKYLIYKLERACSHNKFIF